MYDSCDINVSEWNHHYNNQKQVQVDFITSAPTWLHDSHSINNRTIISDRNQKFKMFIFPPQSLLPIKTINKTFCMKFDCVCLDSGSVILQNIFLTKGRHTTIVPFGSRIVLRRNFVEKINHSWRLKTPKLCSEWNKVDQKSTTFHYPIFVSVQKWLLPPHSS